MKCDVLRQSNEQQIENRQSNAGHKVLDWMDLHRPGDFSGDEQREYQPNKQQPVLNSALGYQIKINEFDQFHAKVVCQELRAGACCPDCKVSSDVGGKLHDFPVGDKAIVYGS